MKIKCHDCTATHKTQWWHWLLSKFIKSWPICGHKDTCVNGFGEGLKVLCCNNCARLTAHFVHPSHWMTFQL